MPTSPANSAKEPQPVRVRRLRRYLSRRYRGAAAWLRDMIFCAFVERRDRLGEDLLMRACDDIMSQAGENNPKQRIGFF